MKPVLVHVHIYYAQVWEELKECLKNISSYPYDLYVTMVEENPALEKDILILKPDANIQIVENRGYDIGPFVSVINQVDLDRYDYVIKLHTKRNISNPKVNLAFFKGDNWRNYLLGFIKSKDVFERQMAALRKEKDLLAVCHFSVIFSIRHDPKKERKKFEAFLSQYKMKYFPFSFVAGTMFMMKASLLKELKALNLSIRDFEAPSGKEPIQLAHMLERYLGYIVYKNNGYIADRAVGRADYFKYKFFMLLFLIQKFFYYTKVTSKNKKLIKICKIPVMSLKIKESDILFNQGSAEKEGI